MAGRGQSDPPVLPLSDVLTGQEVVLAEITGGRGFRHRLTEMGLTPGIRLEVVNRGRPGPMIISVKGTRLMLGRGAAHRVLVCPPSAERPRNEEV
ncbi:MAG: FeoA family protein [Planctomycetota bacterium]